MFAYQFEDVSQPQRPGHAAADDAMPPAPMLCRWRRCYAAGDDAMPPAPMLCHTHSTLTVAM